MRHVGFGAMRAERRRLVTVVVSLLLFGGALISGAIVGWSVGDHSKRDWLLSYAGSTELFGIVLLATPELVPLANSAASAMAAGFRRLWGAVRTLGRRIEHIGRRLLNRPRGPIVHTGAAVGRARVGGDLTVTRSVSEGASLEEKVAFLLERDQEVQVWIRQRELEIGRLPLSWREDIERASTALRDEQAKAIQALRETHLRARLLGIALLVVGVFLNTWGNLA
jgi:hypothetical protein